MYERVAIESVTISHLDYIHVISKGYKGKHNHNPCQGLFTSLQNSNKSYPNASFLGQPFSFIFEAKTKLFGGIGMNNGIGMTENHPPPQKKKQQLLSLASKVEYLLFASPGFGCNVDQINTQRTCNVAFAPQKISAYGHKTIMSWRKS